MKNNNLYVPDCELCQKKYNKRLSKLIRKLQSAVGIGLVELDMPPTEFLFYVLNELESCQEAIEEDEFVGGAVYDSR